MAAERALRGAGLPSEMDQILTQSNDFLYRYHACEYLNLSSAGTLRRLHDVDFTFSADFCTQTARIHVCLMTKTPDPTTD